MPSSKMRSERLRRKWTQSFVAQIVGVTVTSISDIENGKAKPSYRVLCALEELFEMSHRDLFGRCKLGKGER